MKTFIVQFLAFIGAAVLICALGGLVFFGDFSYDEPVKALSESKSPNGNYKALTYITMGGGAAGSCDQIVLVIRNTQQVSIKEANHSIQNHAFRGGCNDHVEASWLNDTQLKVEFASPRLTGGSSIYMNPFVQKNEISVQFVLTP